MDVKTVCPLGCECEQVASDGKSIERCAWFVQMQGENPQTGEAVNDWRCAMAWQPILMVESTRATTQNSAAIESHRNETNKRQEQAIRLAASLGGATDGPQKLTSA